MLTMAGLLKPNSHQDLQALGYERCTCDVLQGQRAGIPATLYLGGSKNSQVKMAEPRKYLTLKLRSGVSCHCKPSEFLMNCIPRTSIFSLQSLTE